VAPILTRPEKIRNFKLICQCAEKYFKDLNEPSVIPLNFGPQIDQLVDIHSQKALLVTIDLIIVVMLNSEQSENYIERIMSLSDDAQDDIQKLIMRSKTNLNDLISSQQSQSEFNAGGGGMLSDRYIVGDNLIEDNNSEQLDRNLLEEAIASSDN